MNASNGPSALAYCAARPKVRTGPSMVANSKTCAYCAEPMNAAAMMCPPCDSVDRSQFPGGRAATAAPISPTGDASKTCPRCNGVIHAQAIKCRHCKSDVPRHAQATRRGPAQRREWAHIDSAVPLLDWKGISKLTTKPAVPSLCQSCGMEWMLAASVANELAQEQGLGGRMQRRGKAMEQFGATYSPFSSRRRIAAGNERQRMEESLQRLYRRAACPGCGSTKILLAKP